MSGQMDRQDKELDAAEYVIGTLSAVERAAFEVLIAQDKDTQKDVAFWERSFGALNASVSPETPPKNMWSRIEKSLFDEHSTTGDASAAATAVSMAKPSSVANDNSSDALRRSRGRWRLSAIAATLAAIGLGAYVYTQQLVPGLGQNGTIGPIAGSETAKEYIAVVNANGDQPSLVVSVNAETGQVTVRSIGVQRPDGKSLELWYVPEGQKAVSVGLVGEGGIDLKDIKAKDGDLLAISLEPSGGSPTGTATGPVIYTGKLIENEAE